MSNIEHVLEPGSAKMPVCLCGHDMRIDKIEPHAADADTELREFSCDCGHTMKLMMWKEAA